MARLEHANITVSDLDATADAYASWFGWRVRWQGASIHGGRSIHVGGANDYLRNLFAGGRKAARRKRRIGYGHVGALNHIGVVVDDLDAVERKVVSIGLTPHSHADYEPGRRFYFDDPDGIEFESRTVRLIEAS